MDFSCGVCQQILRGWGDINMQILGLHWWVEAVFGRKNMAVVPYTALTLCYLLLFLRRISELWQHNFKNLPEIQEQLLNRLHATQKVSFTCASSMVEMLDPLHKFGSRFLLRWKTMPNIKGERIFHYQISAGFFMYPPTNEADSVHCACSLTLCDLFLDTLSSGQRMIVHEHSLFHSSMIQIGSTEQSLSWSWQSPSTLALLSPNMLLTVLLSS